MFKLFGQTWKLTDGTLGGLIVLGAILALLGIIFIPSEIIGPVLVAAIIIALVIFIVVSARVKPTKVED